MNIPPNAALFVAQFEGFSPRAYVCPAGVLTIGYGTTSAAGLIEVKRGMTVSQNEAMDLLQRTLEAFADQIYPLFNRVPLGREGLAMLSLAYNIGPSAFRRSSVLRHFNAGNTAKAADSFLLWNKANGKVLKGLKIRRITERSCFLMGTSSNVLLLRPSIL